MLDAASNALVLLADPFRFGMLLLGVLLGIIVGILPGVGGMFIAAILLPFVLNMEPYAGLALLVGAWAVCATSDAVSSILIGVPGSGLAAATILDGYPMAKRGEALRALGAAFFGSMCGGVFSAVALTLSLPIARPLIMLMGSPEFFMLSLLGVVMIGTLAGRRPLKGVAAAVLGLLLATVGAGPMTAYGRYTFDVPYLFDGIPLAVFALGIYALPEIFDALLQGSPIAGVGARLEKGWGELMEGVKDCFRHWSIVLWSSALGTYIGFLPGLGGAAASWMAYSHVVQTAKDKENFGKGDVRGVIAPETANNAKEGGSFIVTILFGIPGSAVMALFLIAFLAFGATPGPNMLTKNLDLTFVIIWSLAISSVLVTVVCFLLARPLAAITTLPVYYWAPPILFFVILGAFQTTQSWGDLLLLLGVGFLGWVMKRTGWPRPPMVIGLVLGTIAERYLMLSMRLFGMSWLLHPGVIVIGVLTVASVFTVVRWQRRMSASGQGGA